MKSRHPGFVILSVLLTILIIVVILNSVLLRTSLNLSLVSDRADALQLSIFHQSAVKWVRTVLYQDQIHFSFSSDHSIIATPVHDMPVGPGFLSGYIEDMQGKWNVNSLFVGPNIDPEGVTIFRRLLLLDACPSSLADAVVAWHIQHPTRSLVDYAELTTIPGFSQTVLARLALDVTVLPEASLVNINTATVHVLQAIMPTIRTEELNQLLIARSYAPIISLEYAVRLLPSVPVHILNTHYVVKSDYFQLHGEVRLHTVTSELTILFHRIAAAMPIVVWQRFSW